jgi:glycine cleavage system aminomethyltransferase T
VSFEFMSPTATGAVARSPMDRQARRAGARFEVRDGWSIAVAFADAGAALRAVAFSDCSHVRKYELQGDLPALELGRATVDGDSTWLPLTATRALVLGGEPPASALDVTTAYGALRLAGPLARETFARFTAIDLRPHVTRPGDWRPGSVARTPGGILCEGEDCYLMLFGSALGQYVWTVVEDAARRLGGGPVGYDALVRGEAGDEASAEAGATGA